MSTRAWFRLTDVQPLAEHAMACPDHRLTTPQVRAGGPLRPALDWTATGDGQDLSSNGVPVWYDEDGQEHAAQAWTWHHPATSRSGHPTRPSVDTAYLPLDLPTNHARGRLSVIDALRDGRHTGAHWLVIDLDAIDGHLIGPQAVRLLDHRDEIVPPEATWRAADVTAAAVGHCVYPALIADGYTVRGDDVLPRFERGTVDQMAADLAVVNVNSMPGEIAVLRFDGDVLVVLFEHDDGVQTRQRETDRVYPDPSGFYSPGAYQWPWTPV